MYRTAALLDWIHAKTDDQAVEAIINLASMQRYRWIPATYDPPQPEEWEPIADDDNCEYYDDER